MLLRIYQWNLNSLQVSIRLIYKAYVFLIKSNAVKVTYLFTELEHSNKKLVQFAEEVEVKTLKRELEVIEVEIDEKKMDRLLHLLHEADPQCDSSSDPQEMLDLEGILNIIQYNV